MLYIIPIAVIIIGILGLLNLRLQRKNMPSADAQARKKYDIIPITLFALGIAMGVASLCIKLYLLATGH